MTKENGSLTKYQVGELQEDVKALKTDVTRILQNHLPHLQAEMMSLKTRIMVLTAINIGAIILAVIIQKAFK